MKNEPNFVLVAWSADKLTTSVTQLKFFLCLISFESPGKWNQMTTSILTSLPGWSICSCLFVNRRKGGKTTSQKSVWPDNCYPISAYLRHSNAYKTTWDTRWWSAEQWDNHSWNSDPFPSSLILSPRTLPFHFTLHVCFFFNNSFVNDERFVQIDENIFTFQACLWDLKTNMRRSSGSSHEERIKSSLKGG